jgi:L-threonylcarbamoyladenylate synthase
MKLLKTNINDIKIAAEIIKAGGLVAFPTETVYGLGADGLNPLASAKIFEAKNRPSFNPLILHISKIEQLKEIGKCKNPAIEKLVSKFFPGPLTLVIQKNKIVPEIITAGNETVAVRMPDHQVALKLIEEAGTPIAAPSANVFGQLSPTDAEHVNKQLGNKIDAIIDGGKCKVGVESTILEITDHQIFLLRPGGLSIEDIEHVVGKILIKNSDSIKPNSPGQLLQHYSPNIPLRILNDELLQKNKNKKIGALLFKENNFNYDFASIKILSAKGDLREAAANFFSALHQFENENIDLILAEPVEEIGLGRAIMDRLRKAEYKYK